MIKKLAPLTGVLYFLLLLVALLTGTNSLNASSSPRKVFAYSLRTARALASPAS